MKRPYFYCILLILSYALSESFALTALFFLKNFRSIDYAPADRLTSSQVATIESFIDGSFNYFKFDPVTGWTIRRNGMYKDLYRANEAGIRGDREYSFEKPGGVVRICSFGDSFTHCDDVGNDATWQAFMEEADEKLEVVNFGVGAYGLDQAYLRYRDKGRRYETDIVLIGFMPENIFRMVNTFRAFYQVDTGLPLSKPRFVPDNDGITLVPNPLPTLEHYRALLDHPREKLPALGMHDYFYQQRYVSGAFDWSPAVRLYKILSEHVAKRFSDSEPVRMGIYNRNSEAFTVTTRVFDLFYRSCPAPVQPIILVFPHNGNMRQFMDSGIREYAPLLEFFDSRGYCYIDLMDAFQAVLREGNPDGLFTGQHYSAEANMLVARYIARALDGTLNR